MSLGGIVSKLTGAKDVVELAGKGVGNILDRFIPKKMSEEEKWEKVKDAMRYDLTQGKLEIADVNKAREMWMTYLKTQHIPWIASLLNAIYRPFCGFMAIFYLTDKFWAQVLTQLLPNFKWTLIDRDPVTDALIGVIIYFFFGLRQRSKEKNVTDVS